MTTCYDRNGRISWVSKDRTTDDCINSGGGSKPVYASVGSYYPPGEINTLTAGNGLIETDDVRNRLQTWGVNASVAGTTRMSLQFYYCPGQQSSCTTNNGNLWSQNITRRRPTACRRRLQAPLVTDRLLRREAQ
jgi:hypothetical protein